MKRAGLSAVSRAGIAAAFGIAASVLMPIACGVDTQPQAPPRVTTGTGSSVSGGGAGGAGGSSDATTSGGPGPANLCECTAAAFAPSSICADCFHQVSGVDCADSVTTCQKDPACVALIVALAACEAKVTCISDTLATHPGRNPYLDVLACVCVSCATSCALSEVVDCDAGKIPVEAGSDAGDAGDEASSDGGDASDDGASDGGDAGDETSSDGGDASDDVADAGEDAEEAGG